MTIAQNLYTNGADFLLLDDGVSPPDGYTLSENPPPSATYKQTLEALNTAYQADVTKLNNAYALTLLADGPTEAAKMATIRAQYEARKTLHISNIAALKLEYGV